MSKVKRPRIPGATIFFQVSLRNPASDLLIREINLLRFAVARTRKDWPVAVDAWTVLPNQMMCIWTLPEHDTDYSTRWRLIKSRFSRALPLGRQSTSHILRKERAIWQRRFWEHHIRNEAEFRLYMQRCYTFPADLGLVRDPAHWQYSSFFKARRKNELAA